MLFRSDVTDTRRKMVELATAQLDRQGFAIDRYFYRSHVTYEAELENIVFKSWLYAGHIGQLANNGDYFLLELGEDSIIISRDEDGQICAMHNVCRHRGARVVEELSGNRRAFSLMAFAHATDFLAQGTVGQADFAKNMVNYYDEVRLNDKVLTHTLINPSVSHSQFNTGKFDQEVALHVVKDH